MKQDWFALLLAAFVLSGDTFAHQQQSLPVRSVSIELTGISLGGRYYPAGCESPSAGLLLLHGWTWPGRDAGRELDRFARLFQRACYTVLAPSLRGWPPSGGSDDCAGRQVDDALQALDWLARQPEVDAERRFMAGYSQGGQVVLLAAARGAPVRAVAAFAAVIDPGAWNETNRIEGIRDYLADECGGPDGWRSRDVMAVAEHLRQPLLLVHGDADQRVPTAQSIGLYNRLQALRRPVQLEMPAGVGHEREDVLQPRLAIEFFNAHERPAQP